MIYEMDEKITIRSLRPEDAQVIAREEVAQGWVNASPKKYEQRLRDQQEGKAIALAAEYCGQVAGYINVYLAPERASRRLSILGCWQSTVTAASAAG